VARRDEVIAYANELLSLDAYPDYGPMGLQVVGSEDVSRIVCGVSASRELFERAAAVGAELVLVHHGILWNNESRVVDRRLRGRLEALFAADITLAAYHLALDAHPELGNNALLARALGIEPSRAFARIGVAGPLRQPCRIDEFVDRVRSAVDRDPLVYAEGPPEIRSAALVTGGGGKSVLDAAAEGYDLFVTGEPEEPSARDARELEIHFVAAGHHATEKLGIQALAAALGERFGLEWSFVDLPNPV
jgi:dinuclear metal center YbgI/SA1388 family protein